MTNQMGRTVGVAIVGLGLLALVISAPAGDPPDLGDRAAEQLRAQTGDRIPVTGDAPEAVVERWGGASRKAALAVIEKYGPPDEVSEGQLVWHNTGAFRKTIVYKEEIPHNFPVAHVDVIEQFIEYRFPLEKYSELARFDGSLHADRTAGLLSARGQTEQDNLLSLNLAHEIAQGRRSAAAARSALVRLKRLSAAGKASPYAKGLLFRARGHAQPDPDRVTAR